MGHADRDVERRSDEIDPSTGASSAFSASSSVVVRPRHRGKHGRLRGIEDRHEARCGGEAPPQHLERLGTLTLGRAQAQGGALVQNVAEGQGEGGAIVLQVDVVPGAAPAPGEGEQCKEKDDEEGHQGRQNSTLTRGRWGSVGSKGIDAYGQ